jgi:hypothetical protein
VSTSFEEILLVTGSLCLSGKDQIAQEILAYLAEYPEAQDTFDGIVQWWLLEQKIKYQVNLVREVLAELVSKGLLVEYKSRDSRIHYRTNETSHKEIRRVLNRRPMEEDKKDDH